MRRLCLSVQQLLVVSRQPLLLLGLMPAQLLQSFPSLKVQPPAGSNLAASGAPQPAVAVRQLMKLSLRLASWYQAVLLSLQGLYCWMLCHNQRASPGRCTRALSLRLASW